jgi:hypothetical protein
MMMEHASRRLRAAPAQRAANVRTGLILLSIAMVFFGGFFVVRYAGRSAAGIGVLGLAILGFLLVAIVRHVRR